MKRHTIEELCKLLEGTTDTVWTEDKVGTIFRSSSEGRKVLMAQVKDDEGRPNSESNRANAMLMIQARNLAVDLLDARNEAGELRHEIEVVTAMVKGRLQRLENQNRRLKAALPPHVVMEALEGEAYRDTFDICNPGEPGAGIPYMTDTVVIEVESGDPGGDAGAFREFMLAALKEWYDGARVCVRLNGFGEKCPECHSLETSPKSGHNGVQSDGQEVGVTCYLCNQCKAEWSA